MKITTGNKFQDVLTILVVMYISASNRLNLKSLMLRTVDSLYWTLYHLEDIQQYNDKTGYTQGNWAPVSMELNQHSLHVTGYLPSEIRDSMYVRMGANAKCWPPTGIHHAFNGEAMIHQIFFKDATTIEYSNSWVESSKEETLNPFSNETCSGASCGTPYFSFGDLNYGGFSLVRLLLVKLRNMILGVKTPTTERLQPGSTSLITHGQKMFTASEIVLPYEISLKRDGVKPKGFSDFNGLLSNQTVGPKEGTMSPHPRTDPTTGDLIFFSANHGAGAVPILNFGILHPDGSPKKYLQIPVPSPPAAFYHDMFLTENYAIFFHSSLKKDTSRLAKMKGITFFDKQSNLSFGILPKNASSHNEVIWIQAPSAGHIWHTVAAREEGDVLTLFAPKFSSYSDDVRIHLPSEEPSYLTKFTINLVTKTCTEKVIFDEVVERPSVHPDVLYPTYAYLRSEGKTSSEMGKTIIKYNLNTETVEGSIDCGDTCHFGESLFVPSQNSTAEDDGFLMDIPYFPESHTSKLMVWSASSLKSLAVADLPQRVPYGAHGKWLASNLFN